MINFPKSRRNVLLTLIASLVVLAAMVSPSAFAAQQDEYERFGLNTANDLVEGDGKAFTDAVDREAVLDRIFEGMSDEDKTVHDFRKGFNKGFAQVGDAMVSNFSDANVKFLRARDKDNKRTALLRIDFGDKGINFLDFILEKNDKGDIKIVDWYDYSKGQLYTDSVRQVIALLLPEEKTLFEKLLGISGLNRKEVDQFVELGKLMQEQNYSEWIRKYHKLSPKLKNSRILLLTRVMVASMHGEESEYRLSLKDLHDKMGDDPTLSLILIDYYFYEKDFQSAQKALDNLSEHIGGDASIDALRANLYLTAGDYAKSSTYARRAIGQDAAYEDSYWTLLDASIFGNEYETAVSTLEKLESDFGYIIGPEEFETDQAYKKFSESNAYKKWKEKKSSGKE